MTTSKRRQLERRTERRMALRQRQAKMAAAKHCYEMARFYKDQDALPGVAYWEHELNRCTAEAAALGM